MVEVFNHNLKSINLTLLVGGKRDSISWKTEYATHITNPKNPMQIHYKNAMPNSTENAIQILI
ncbi:hypothetical protein HanPI659440_Chr07g0271941 [Helianthus annuus]|nr:hypothetical protein HanPI659440_Chr07g0271941 [Helianthus annuus]